MWWYFINTLSLSLCLINGLRRIQWYVARFLFTDSFRHISDPIRSMRSVLFPFGFATFICFGHDLLRSYTYSTSGPWLPNSIENNVTSNVRSAYTWTRTQTHISASSLILNMNLITHERYICLRLRAWKHGKLTHTHTKQTGEKCQPQNCYLWQHVLYFEIQMRSVYISSYAWPMFVSHIHQVPTHHIES